MSVPLPLVVRLSTALRDVHVTADLRDLTFRSVVPGGYASATVSLDRPLTLDPDEISLYGKMYVYDGRSAATIWEGRLEDPGRTASGDGQVWQLTAVGPAAHARDRTVPLIYVDTSLERWERADNVRPGADTRTGTDPGDTAATAAQALILQFPTSLAVVTGDRAVMRYWTIREAGQKVARIDYTWDAGTTTVDLAVEGVARTAGGAGDVARTQTFNTAGAGSAGKVVVTNWANGRNTVDLRINYTGAGGTFGADIYWASIMNVVVQAMRYNAAGSELTTGYTANTVLASDVVNDLLGRLLTAYDGAGAVVATTAYAIDQLAYPDGVTAEQVLADLMVLEPAYYWAAWESNTAGEYRFEWKAWPTTVRYEADVLDGFDSPGSAADLYNTVRVRYRDINGRITNVQRTAAVQALTDAGLTREGFLDLGDELASLANAQRAGDQFLAEHASAPNAGRLTIARPVLDLTSGRIVAPWEIRPGELVRVRGVLPSVDSLNATARDGVTVFRIVSIEYRASDASVTLELDSYSTTVARALADLRKRPTSRRR